MFCYSLTLFLISNKITKIHNIVKYFFKVFIPIVVMVFLSIKSGLFSHFQSSIANPPALPNSHFHPCLMTANRIPQPPLATLAQIDQLFNSNQPPEGIFRELRRIYKATEENSRSVDLLYRLAKCCLRRGLDVSNEDQAGKKRRRELLETGVAYANLALRKDPQHFEALKFKCMLMGQIFDHGMAIKEKAERGLKLYNYLEKAAQMNPNQHEIQHMQGRLAYSVAHLNYFERLTAGLLFPAMKALLQRASVPYAINKLRQCEETTRGTSIDNMFYLAKCYQRADDVDAAKDCFRSVIGIRPVNVYERALVEESRRTLAKLGPYQKNKVGGQMTVNSLRNRHHKRNRQFAVI